MKLFIKQHRLKTRWSQSDLAKITGLSLSTIRKLEQDRSVNPSLHAINKIAYALDVDIRKLYKDLIEDIDYNDALRHNVLANISHIKNEKANS